MARSTAAGSWSVKTSLGYGDSTCRRNLDMLARCVATLNPLARTTIPLASFTPTIPDTRERRPIVSGKMSTLVRLGTL